MKTVGTHRKQIKDFSSFGAATQTTAAAEASPARVTTRTAQDGRQGRGQQGGMTTKTSVREDVAALCLLFVQTLKGIFFSPGSSQPFQTTPHQAHLALKQGVGFQAIPSPGHKITSNLPALQVDGQHSP